MTKDNQEWKQVGVDILGIPVLAKGEFDMKNHMRVMQTGEEPRCWRINPETVRYIIDWDGLDKY
jgi:hypothetical protein